MKTMKSAQLFLGAIGIAFLIFGCQKDDTLSFAPPAGNPAQIGAPGTKGYLAEYNPSGTCSGPPIVVKNGDLWYYNATTGATQTTAINGNCWAAACAHKSGGSMYLAISDASNGVSQLYTVGNHDGVLTSVTAINYSGNPLHVNEMEFAPNNKLYIFASPNDDYIYEMDMSTFAVTRYSLFTSSTNYKKALAFDENNSKLYVAYETSTTSNTLVGEYNTTSHTLGSTTAYSIPNCFTNNLSYYNFQGNHYFIRDNGSGTATIYNSAGSALANTLSARVNHDAASIP